MNNLKSMRYGDLELHLINTEGADEVRTMLQNEPDSQELVEELDENYLPKYDDENRRTVYGFYILKGAKLAGLSLLEVDSWPDMRGSTGADILPHMRGQGLAPAAKIGLFHLAFALLELNRIDTGHFVSNRASQRSIEKTPGFQLEGLLREYGRNPEGQFEDTLYYGIIRRDWLDLYKDAAVEVIYE